MPNENILFQLAAPANLQTGMRTALDNQSAFNEFQQQPIRNAMLEGQLDQQELTNQRLRQQITEENAGFVLSDMAQDAIRLKPLLQSGDTMRANVLLAERIKKIQDRGGDPTDTMAFRDALNSGQVTPEQAVGQLDGIIDSATQAGLLESSMKTAGMREWEQMTEGFSDQELADAQRVKAGLKAREVMTGPRTAEIGGVTYVIDPETSRATLPTVTNQPVPGQNLDGNIPPPTPTVLDPSTVASNAATVKGGEEAGKQAIKLSGEALQKIPVVRRSIATIDQAISAVDKGANTGVIASEFPSVTAASVELDNIRGSMGLDVIAGTTFGALSEAELAFALDTALPTKLEGPELKDWLQRKKAAQTKLAGELEEAAIYLGKPGNTAAGWLEMKRNQPANKNAQDMSDDELMKQLGI